MKARMKAHPSGLYNGQPWPEVGDVVDLPDHVAEGMIDAGHLERLGKVETRPAPDDAETREAKPRPAKRGRTAS
jgi:hypothetical protein